MKASEIRESFLGFFERNGHKRVESDSLVPGNDPTLLFTSAGMVQFKPLYVAKNRPYSRATTSQRCLRTTDIDRVGLTARHLTFFEMLGNFSFGDYFKEKTIAYAWEFLTEVLRIDPALLYVTVFENDDDAENLWRKFVPAEKIIRFGADDNYWPAGSALNGWVGPNGPCSEIFFDTGPQNCCFEKKCSRPGEHECDRFPEIWDLVFPQFIRGKDGDNPRMATPGIDTGMGFERLVAVMQGKRSNFETDLFLPLFEKLGECLVDIKSDASVERAYRIVADHARAATFLVHDGIVPSNDGRGYVLRRLIRRATRFSALMARPGRELKPIVAELVPAVIGTMTDACRDLGERGGEIREIIAREEETFLAVVERGSAVIREMRAKTAKLTGERAFYLWDTFGFPRELTEDIWVRELSLALSPDFEKEYQASLGEQQDKARAAWKGSGARALTEVHHALAREVGATEFVGYTTPMVQARIVAIVRGGESAPETKGGETVDLILDRTPFYAEAGGQVADRGLIRFHGGQAEVVDVQRPVGGMFIHTARVLDGVLASGTTVEAEVDGGRRAATARHHTATHLMHAALQQVVGRGTTQSGSMVSPDRLRFDFMSMKPVSLAELRAIEDIVNAKIIENLPVVTTETTPEEARRAGAQALFGEKYGDKVRMVEVAGFSRELCGGTHVPATGNLGSFVIVAEGAVASGVRRIEALAGFAALTALMKQRSSVERVASLLKCGPRDVEARVGKLLEERREIENSLKAIKGRQAREELSGQISGAAEMHGVKVLLTEVAADDPAALRVLADQAFEKLRDGVVVIGSRTEDKCFFVARVSSALAKRVRAGDLVKAAAAAVGGTGGGKPEMAQAGGKDPAKLPEALARAREFLDSKLKGV